MNAHGQSGAQTAAIQIAWVVRRAGRDERLRWTLTPSPDGAQEASWQSESGAIPSSDSPTSTWPVTLTSCSDGLVHIDVPGLLAATLRVSGESPELLYACTSLVPTPSTACSERPQLRHVGDWRPLLGMPIVELPRGRLAPRLSATT